jgi:hypothetical protein
LGREKTFFLRHDGAPVAYAFWQALDGMARIVHVVVDPGVRHRGLGNAIMGELAARARRAGCSRWMLNVKPDNVPALRLYRSWGMQVVTRAVGMQISWSDVEKVSRIEERDEATAFLVAPEDEARVELATGLVAGQIEALRKGGGWVFVGLRRGDDAVAFAAFDPTFPGASPFAARTPGTARALLEAMKPHAKPEHDYVRFTTSEDTVEIAAKAAGAEVVLEMLRMEGEIPATVRAEAKSCDRPGGQESAGSS